MQRFTLPRDLYHGKGALEALKNLKGKKAVICVGGGSMKKFGFLDKAEKYLKAKEELDISKAQYAHRMLQIETAKLESLTSQIEKITKAIEEGSEKKAELQKELAAKKYPFSNNGRIDAVKPVLAKAGIQTKEIES